MTYKTKLKIVELEKNDYHTLINGSVCGHPLRIVIDTGASRSCMDVEFAKEILPELQTAHHDGVSAGIGGNDFEVQTTDVPNLKIGRYLMETYNDIALINFSYINEAYQRLHKKPIQMILGNDFFVEHKAVINYQDNQLYFTIEK